MWCTMLRIYNPFVASLAYQLVLNMKHVTPARIGARVGFTRVRVRSIGVRVWLRSSQWVHEAFMVPTRWYRQRELLALGALPNTKPQCELVRVLVEYRRNISIQSPTPWEMNG